MLSQKFHSQVRIQAPIEMVWEVLSDFPKYEQWNPFIRGIEGPLQKGAPCEVVLNFRGKLVTLHPFITHILAAHDIEMQGNFFFRWILSFTHEFRIIQETGTTVVVQENEKFAGLLLPALLRLIRRDIVPGLDLMNQALKARVEDTLIHRIHPTLQEDIRQGWLRISK